MNKLEIIEKTEEYLGEETIVFYIRDKDGNQLNLTDEVFCEIEEVNDIINDDLIFVLNTSGDMGIYSFRRKELIFPFVISDYNCVNVIPNIELIDIIVNPGTMQSVIEELDAYDLNSEIDQLYIDLNGEPILNFGTIVEKINDDLWMLYDQINGSKYVKSDYSKTGTIQEVTYNYKLYDTFNDKLLYSKIAHYTVSNNRKSLEIEIGEWNDKRVVTIEI